MTEKLIFWAQALDNTSPDHIDMLGEELSPNDPVRRQEAVSLVYSVVKVGTRIFDHRGVRLTKNGRHFVVEVPAAERDCAGRTAPIICYGDYDPTTGDALGAAVVAGLDTFAKQIGRNIFPEHLGLARESFAALKKKILDEEARARGRDWSGGVLPIGHDILARFKGFVRKSTEGVQSPIGVSTVSIQQLRKINAEEFRAMAAGLFPSDPISRKVILVLQQHDVEKCYYEPGAAQTLLDEETYVLQWPLSMQSEIPSALQNLLDAGLARPGSILVQNPYDVDTYEDASLAPQRFALAKHMHFSTLCMHLGAKEVSVEQIDLRTRTGKTSLDVKGDRPGGNAQIMVESEELDKFRAQMHLRDEFTGGPPDVAAAERLLRRTGLWSDPNMRTLIEMRRDSSNQLMTRKLVLSLSSEAQRNLNIVGRLKVPSFIKLSAAYDRAVSEQYDYTLTVLVRF